MAYADGGFSLPVAMAAALGALFIQIGTNFANDYFDFKKGTDDGDRLGPTRATQAGWVTPSAMKTATAIAFGIAFLIGIYLVFRGGWPVVAIGLTSILFGVLYTGGPCPLGYNGLADIFVLIFFGPVAVGGTYYVQTLTITTPVIMAGLAPGLFSVAILTVNNLRDIENDRAGGKKTLAVRFGKRFSIVEYIASVAVACAIPAVLLMYDGPPFALLACGTVVLSLPQIKSVRTITGRELNNTLAATGSALLIYSLLFSIGWIL